MDTSSMMTKSTSSGRLRFFESRLPRVVLEQPVNRHRSFAGAFGHPLGGTPGRRRQ
jgi:hypothetical protein